MVKVRGDIKYFTSEDGPWRVRFLCRVIQIVGAVGFYSDVVLEKWNASGDLWKPVTMSQKPVKNSARIHLRFRCSGLSPSHEYFFTTSSIFANLDVLLQLRNGNNGGIIA